MNKRSYGKPFENTVILYDLILVEICTLKSCHAIYNKIKTNQKGIYTVYMKSSDAKASKCHLKFSS